MRVLKIIVSVMGFLLLSMVLLPFLFKGNVSKMLQFQINRNLNAKVHFEKFGVDLFRSFPNLTASLSGLTVVGNGPFSKDTLLFARELDLTFDWRTMISKNGFSVKRIGIDGAVVRARVLPDGRANWDVFRVDTAAEKERKPSEEVHLELEKVVVRHSNVVYDDRQSGMKVELKNGNGTLKGDLGADKTELRTRFGVESLSFEVGNIPVLQRVRLETEASVEADLKRSRFAFKSNKIVWNAVETSLDGWVQLPDTSTVDMNLKVNTEKITFKQLLSLIPAFFRKGFDSIQASGDLKIQAFVKGRMQGGTYPAFGVKLELGNGNIRYPELPESIRDIRLQAMVSSNGGALDNVRVDVPVFHFNVGGNPFDLTAHLSRLVSDPEVRGSLRGVIDLGSVKEVYPLDKETVLKGRLEADVSASGRFSDLEKKPYDCFRMDGRLVVKGANYAFPGLPETTVSEAVVGFSSNRVVLQTLSVVMGRNDLRISGKLDNLPAYFLNEGVLGGMLDVSSSYLNLNDLMQKDTVTVAKSDTTPVRAFEVPRNLNIRLGFSGRKVLYDKLTMNSVHAVLSVERRCVSLGNVAANALGGTIGLSGYYETWNPKEPYSVLALNLNNVSFVQTAQTFEMVRKFVPLFEKVQGGFSMKMNFRSALDERMNPNLNTCAGEGVLRSNNVRISGVKALDALADVLHKESLKTLSPKDIQVAFKISNGKVYTSPFDVRVDRTVLTLSGKTGLDKSIDYDVCVNLDGADFGSGATSLKGKIEGTFDHPKVRVDAASLVKQVAVGMVDKLLEKTTGKNVSETMAKTREDLVKQAEQIRSQAKLAGDQLIENAQKAGDELISNAKNPVMKLTAKTTAAKLKSEAQKKAAGLNAQAEEKIKEMYQLENRK